jgi:hypothetical protein
VANVFEMLLTGEMYSADLLKQAAVDFIRLNGSEVLRTAAWRQFVREQPRLMDYVVARLAGVPPPIPDDYDEESDDGEGVEKDSSQKEEEACQTGPEEVSPSYVEDDDGESPNKKCKAQ